MKYKYMMIIGLWIILFIACAHKPNLQSQSHDLNLKPLYLLRHGDILEIKFSDNDRFSREVTIRPDGRITLEKVGDIYAAGLTTQQLDSLIEYKYKDILKSPDITTFVKHFSNQKVYVLGEVQLPGGYLIEGDMTVTHAIAMAGGHKRSANLKSVLLISKSTEGKPKAERLNLTKILSSKVNVEDKLIEALDVIYVPKTFIANVDAFVDQFFNVLLPPVDIFWRIWFIDRMNRE